MYIYLYRIDIIEWKYTTHVILTAATEMLDIKPVKCRKRGLKI